MAVVLAAHRVRPAIAAALAEDVERGAGQPNHRRHIPEDDTEEAQDRGRQGGVGLDIRSPRVSISFASR